MNKFGLSRYIPSDVKHAVRLKANFGCSICGLAIGQYHHYDPEFSEAQSHQPNGIVFLCNNHHADAGSRRIPLRTIRKCWENPYCSQNTPPFFSIHVDNASPTIIMGGCKFKNCKVPILIRDLPLIMIEAPEYINGPYRISGRFFNSVGQLSLVIKRNEIEYSIDNWDIECVSNRIIIRDSKGLVSLDVILDSENNTLNIIRLNAFVRGVRVKCVENLMEFNAGPGWNRFGGGSATDCQVGISIESGNFDYLGQYNDGLVDIIGDPIAANDNQLP